MLLAFYMFFSEQVNIAIFETNNSKTYNIINIIKLNVIRIIRLGINHVNTLSLIIKSIT